MNFGKAGKATTSTTTAAHDTITVRKGDLVHDIKGNLSCTEYFHLLTTGRKPTQDQTFFLDLLLVSAAEHKLVQTNQVAQMTYAGMGINFGPQGTKELAS